MGGKAYALHSEEARLEYRHAATETLALFQSSRLFHEPYNIADHTASNVNITDGSTSRHLP
jgi:hypothetical protein